MCSTYRCAPHTGVHTYKTYRCVREYRRAPYIDVLLIRVCFSCRWAPNTGVILIKVCSSYKCAPHTGVLIMQVCSTYRCASYTGVFHQIQVRVVDRHSHSQSSFTDDDGQMTAVLKAIVTSPARRLPPFVFLFSPCIFMFYAGLLTVRLCFMSDIVLFTD